MLFNGIVASCSDGITDEPFGGSVQLEENEDIFVGNHSFDMEYIKYVTGVAVPARERYDERHLPNSCALAYLALEGPSSEWRWSPNEVCEKFNF